MRACWKQEDKYKPLRFGKIATERKSEIKNTNDILLILQKHKNL